MPQSSATSSIAAVVCALALSCTPVGAPGGSTGAGSSAGASAGGQLGGQCRGDFGVSAAASKLETFLAASADFTAAAAELEASLIASCRDMGQQLGLDPAAMQGTPGQSQVEAACMPVSAKLDSELSELRAAGNLKLAVVATPPRCDARVDVYADCMGRCQTEVDPGKLDLQCEGGELRGRFQAAREGELPAGESVTSGRVQVTSPAGVLR